MLKFLISAWQAREEGRWSAGQRPECSLCDCQTATWPWKNSFIATGPIIFINKMTELKFTQVLGRLFAELTPILSLFAVFGHVTVKLLPCKGRIYFSTFETGMDYEFLFVLCNKHGGSDNVLYQALSFRLLTLKCWQGCVNIPGGLSRGGDIHTQPTYPTQGLSRSVSEPEPLI